MPTRLLRLATIAALLAGACSGSSPNSDNTPGNLSITPKVGYSSAEVAAVITGTGFLAKATVPQGGGEPTLDTHHRVFIGDHELTGVTYQSTTKLDATVPAGVPSGTYDLIVENALGNRGTVKAAYTVRDTPPFSATAMVDHPSVSVGQTLTLTVTIANRGQGDVTGFALGTPVLSSSDGGAASPGAVPTAPSRIRVGEQLSFVWTYTPSHAGNISITASATGTDSANGNAVTAELAAPVAVVVNSPAALTATLTPSSATPAAGQPVTMSLALANAAGGGAANVAAVTPSSTPADGVTCTAAAAVSTGAVPSATAPIPIPGGATETFTWTCTPTVAGQYTLGAVVTASDANGGAAITTNVTGVVVTFGASAPDAPGIPSAVAGDGQVTLTWTVPNSNGAPITGYLITPDRGVAAKTTPTAATTYAFDGLTNGTEYSFTVAAINSAGTGLPSAPSSGATPEHNIQYANMSAAVSEFPATAAGGAAVTGTAICTNLGPDVATNATCGVTTNPAVAATVTCTPAPPVATLRHNAFISCSVNYSMPASGSVAVTVTAHSDTSDPDQTNTATATTSVTTVPGAPTDVSAAATVPPVSGSVRVSWTAPANNGGSPITGYTVTVTGGLAPVTPVTTANTSATVSGLTTTPPTLYTFTVTATNALGTGTGTAVSFTPQP